MAALDAVAAAAAPNPLVLDCADIYGGAERLLGDWMAARPQDAAQVVVHTKFVPDLRALPSVSREYVREIVFRSRERLRVDRLEMVQFHWWDFEIAGWANAAAWLAELQDEGVIRHLGTTNFGCRHLGQLLAAGIPVASNQVQLSLLDRRPLRRLTSYCYAQGVPLLAYGTLAGGLLAGDPADDRAGEPLGTDTESRSRAKYRLIAGEIGGATTLARAWAALAETAAQHNATMADVAVAYALAHRAVVAAVVGLSRQGRVVRGRELRLGADEIKRLERAVPDAVPGKVYELERDRSGPHGRIMRYDLNAG